MESEYIVELTPEAENYYYQLTEYLFETHTRENARRKSTEILEMTLSLDRFPHRGANEKRLDYLNEQFKYLIYKITSRKSVKIIYFIDEIQKKVFITDFFGSEMDDDKIEKRSGAQ